MWAAIVVIALCPGCSTLLLTGAICKTSPFLKTNDCWVSKGEQRCKWLKWCDVGPGIGAVQCCQCVAGSDVSSCRFWELTQLGATFWVWDFANFHALCCASMFLNLRLSWSSRSVLVRGPSSIWPRLHPGKVGPNVHERRLLRVERRKTENKKKRKHEK